MQLDFKHIVKDQLFFLALPIIAFIFLLALIGGSGFLDITKMNEYSKTEAKYTELLEKKANLEEQVKEKLKEKVSTALKQIPEYNNSDFGMNATFAPFFEDMLAMAKESGIRIRSVSANYAPSDDIIFSASIQGYNVCELSMVVVGSYTQFQRFFKTLAAQPYLVNFAKFETVSWQRDKSILVTNVKLRFYTRTK